MAGNRLVKAEKAFFDGRYDSARRLYLREVKSGSHDHRVHMRIAMTYYEQGKLEDALEWNASGLGLAPGCPLLLCDRAAILEGLTRNEEAIEAYNAIVRQDPAELAKQTCSRGLPWSRGLVNDCRYRQALLYKRMGEPGQAARLLTEHLENRVWGAESVYSDEEIQRALDAALQLSR